MKKLSTKIAFIILLFASFATVALALFLVTNSETILAKYAGEYQSSIANGALTSIERGFRSRIQATEQISGLPSAQDALNKKFDENNYNQKLLELTHVISGALEISVLDADGKFIASSDFEKVGSVDEEENSLESRLVSLKYSRTASSNIFKDESRNLSIFFVLSPIKEKEAGTIVGFVKATFSSDFIKNKILNTSNGLSAYLIDSLGDILIDGRENSSTPTNNKNFKDTPILKIVQDNVLNYAKATAFSGSRESFYGIAREEKSDERDDNDWVVLVEKDYASLYGPIRNAVYLMIFIVVLLVFGCAFGAIFFTQTSIADPLNELIDAIEQIPQVGFYKAPELKSDNEIGQLNIAFSSSFNELSHLRTSLESRVAEKTSDLEKIIKETSVQNENLEDTKRAMINILEDAKELEGFITNEKNKAEAIIASMGEGLIMVDRNYNVTLINQVTENILGLKREDLIGKNLKTVLQVIRKTSVLNDEDRPISQVFKTGKTVTAGVSDEFFGRTVAREFPIAFIVSPVKNATDDTVIGVVAIFRDITDDKRLNDAKTNFISVASHQLRTPLTSMRWFSEMLLEGDAGKLEEEQVHFVQRIQDSAERMVNLVNLLLQIARMEAGRVMVEPTLVSLKDLTTEVTESLNLTLKAKLQSIEIVVDPKDMPKILLDKDIVWQVVQNLLTNANRYGTPKNAIKVGIVQKGTDIEYSVHNEGIGIPTKQKDRIFEKFFRADNAVKAVPEGSGLGLSLVKSVVNSWGGKVWFESEEGKGATFYFTIPVEGMKPKKGEVKLSI